MFERTASNKSPSNDNLGFPAGSTFDGLIPLKRNRVALDEDEDCIKVEADSICSHKCPQNPSQLLSREDAQ